MLLREIAFLHDLLCPVDNKMITFNTYCVLIETLSVDNNESLLMAGSAALNIYDALSW